MEKPNSQEKKDLDATFDKPPKSFGAKFSCYSVTTQLVLCACIGSYQFGFNISALNTSKDYIIIDQGWCKDSGTDLAISCNQGKLYGSFINGVLFVGAAIGCLLGGLLSEYGRRTSMLIMHILFILGCIMSAVSEGFYSLFLARLVVGVGVGLSTVIVPMYLSEVTTPQKRGFFGVFHQLFITVGIFVGTLLGLAFGDTPIDNISFKLTTFQSVWWRFIVVLPAFFSLIGIILFVSIYNYETPHYLIQMKKKETAIALLREIHGKEDVQCEAKEISNAVREMKVLKAESLSVWTAFADPVYRPVLIIAIVLSLFQQLSGVNVLMANSNKLYSSLNLGNEVVTGITVGMTGLNVLMTFPPIFFVDKLGRRTLMLIGTAGQTICLMVAMIGNFIDDQALPVRWISVASTYGYVISFAIAYGPILWVYLHEIFPAEIKQGAASLASSLNWIAALFVIIPSEYLTAKEIFAIFAFASLISLAFVFVFLKETKGLSIDASPYFKGKQRRIPKSFSRMQSMAKDLEKLEKSNSYSAMRDTTGSTPAVLMSEESKGVTTSTEV